MHLTVCHGCDFRDEIVNGSPCVCTLSGRNILAHAESGECPKNLFADEDQRKKWRRKSRSLATALVLAEALKINPNLDVNEWRRAHRRVPIEPSLPPSDPNHLILVRLESIGDILVMLPAMKYLARDRKVSFVTYKRYAPIVQGIPWLNVIGVDEPMTRPEAIAKFARIGTIRDVNPVVDDRLYSPWDKALWTETGVDLSLFNELPLEIENRDHRAERKLIRLYRKFPRKPLILLNLMAFTSPFPQGDRLRYMLNSWYGRDCEILDLAFVRARRFIDLMGIYERATCLISCDTGTLHLSYATRTPTVALVSDGQGPRSPGCSTPRSHWICRLRYGKATTDIGAKMIRERIDSLFHLPRRRDTARAGYHEKMTA